MKKFGKLVINSTYEIPFEELYERYIGDTVVAKRLTCEIKNLTAKEKVEIEKKIKNDFYKLIRKENAVEIVEAFKEDKTVLSSIVYTYIENFMFILNENSGLWELQLNIDSQRIV